MPDNPTLIPPPSVPGPVHGPTPGPGVGRRKDRVVLLAILGMVILTGGGLATVALTGGGSDLAATPSDTGRGQAGVGAAAASVTTPSAPPTAAGGLPGLIAADDFTGPALDPRWALYDSTSPVGAIWSGSQVRVADGNLVIAGNGRNASGAGNRSGGLCWCGAGGNRLYGRWEVRARFDAGAGYGQVIGLWPESDSEVDGSITFANSSVADKKSLRVYVVWRDPSRRSYEVTLKGDYTAWHTYSVEWRQAFVRIKVDDTVVLDTGARNVTIPAKPMHLFLQQPVGPHEGVPAATAGTPAEVRMAVDWVRLYP